MSLESQSAKDNGRCGQGIVSDDEGIQVQFQQRRDS